MGRNLIFNKDRQFYGEDKLKFSVSTMLPYWREKISLFEFFSAYHTIPLYQKMPRSEVSKLFARRQHLMRWNICGGRPKDVHCHHLTEGRIPVISLIKPRGTVKIWWRAAFGPRAGLGHAWPRYLFGPMLHLNSYAFGHGQTPSYY